MDKSQIVILTAFELLAVFLIVRLWRKRMVSVPKRILWSAVLLLPVFGPVIYGFIEIDPSCHGDDPSDNSEESLQSRRDSDGSPG